MQQSRLQCQGPASCIPEDALNIYISQVRLRIRCTLIEANITCSFDKLCSSALAMVFRSELAAGGGEAWTLSVFQPRMRLRNDGAAEGKDLGRIRTYGYT